MSEPSTAAGMDPRGSPRANVFLMAMLGAGGSTVTVRIRNLSPTGALIDGPDMPNQGEAVRLLRGPHTVLAKVIWRNGQACGLRFASAVPVNEWIGYGAGHTGQQHVDQMIETVRTGGAATLALAASGPGEIEAGDAARQLEAICQRIGAVAESLADVPAVVDQGLVALQDLDLARRSLTELAARLRHSVR